MSSGSRPSSSEVDAKYIGSPVSSGAANDSHLAQSAHSALAFVSNHSLDNLEPTLAALSASSHHQASHGHIPAVAPVSALDLATSSLAAQGLVSSAESPKVKRLNKACDACSRRKVKVSIILESLMISKPL
jgi:hypothetical protein